ncbi:MAG: stage III sporulation protein AA [Lachnospiraceae bacterium]|nr:stage III sporulation protein AA [Lachnospiraceae bacterium]
MTSELIKIFPAGLREKMDRMDLLAEGYAELRFRCNGPLMLLKDREEFFLHKNGGICREAKQAYVMSVNEIREMMEYISNFSVYAHEDELKQGFLTIQGGHRVGICGKVVLAEGKIKTIRNISFLNLRLAREKKGCATPVLPYLFEGDRLCHTLLVSPPGCGKTTLLRDMIRQISDGGSWENPDGTARNFRGRKVGVVDERSELAACYHGIPQNDLGRRTDVLDGCPKTLGIELLLRSMSPEVIAVDELGGEKDAESIEKSVYCGCTILATAHGEGKQTWFLPVGEERKRAIPQGIFERYVFLKPGGCPGIVEAVCDRNGKEIHMSC